MNEIIELYREKAEKDASLTEKLELIIAKRDQLKNSKIQETATKKRRGNPILQGATGQNSIDTISRGLNNSSAAKGMMLDRSNIIFSASKGETGNQMGIEQDFSLMIDTKREDNNYDNMLDELDLSRESQVKPLGMQNISSRRTEPPKNRN